MEPFAVLREEVIACVRCPRLVTYRERIALEKRRAYRACEYWGRPVPGFGDPAAQVLIIGLAPAAHGANRTGRMFTGDSSGDFLYRALFETGFASQPESHHRGDGLELTGAYISATARCAPPDNKPALEEIRNCRTYLERELELLIKLQVVVALGRVAFDNYLKTIRLQPSRFSFGHNVVHDIPGSQATLISSYHPSRQNTSTRKLTSAMLRSVFEEARAQVQR